MKIRRLFRCCFGGILMVLLLCILMPTKAEAATYFDVEGHWAEAAIERWSESGILNGYGNGRFGPDEPITRAELATVLYQIWGCTPQEGLSYVDLDRDEWYYKALSTMEHYEIAIGRGDHIYPDEYLTREEAFYMVGRALVFSEGAEVKRAAISKISDSEEIADAWFGCIRALFNDKILNGSNDGKFHPKDLVTRAEVITVIDNIFDVCISEPGEYTLQATEVALVRCGGVRLTYTGEIKWNNSGHVGYGTYLYLMAGVPKEGVEIQWDGERTRSFGVTVKGVHELGENEYGGYENPWKENHAANAPTVKEDGGILHLAKEDAHRHVAFAGGIGTKTFPYQVKTGEQLFGLAKLYSYSNQSFAADYYVELCNDIVLPSDQALCIPSGKHIFLDGKGHTVTVSLSGEFMPDEGKFGIFKTLNADISNLNLVGKVDVTLIDPDMENVPWYYDRTPIYSVGVLAGEINGTLDHCTSAVDTSIRYHGEWARALDVGNIVGNLVGNASDCKFEGKINVECAGRDIEVLDVGGLAGTATGGTSEWGWIRDSLAAGQITVKGMTKKESVCIGGLTGLVTILRKDVLSSPPDGSPLERNDFGQGMDLIGCGSTVKISGVGGDAIRAGGLVGLYTFHSKMTGKFDGETYGKVENCWSTASLTGKGVGFEGVYGGLIGEIYVGAVQGCWASPTVTAEDGIYRNVGGIVGKITEIGVVSDCWAEVSGLDAEKAGETAQKSYHYGGITGRQDRGVKNSFVLGSGKLSPANAISYWAWSMEENIACTDMTNSTGFQREKFYDACGWDFETVWDKNGTYPILRNCDPEMQRKVQGL